MPSDARTPTTIGDYRVLRVLGRGGMGAVYLADDPVLDRRVAIKVIDGYREHPSARARFLTEARAIARLSHANVVAVYRAGEHDGEPYLVSEFVDGTPLDQLARPVPVATARAIALGLARGLAAAHREGILHRDVKPGNAIVGKDGTVKLLDFGLAKLGEPSAVVAPASAPASTPIAEQPTEPAGPLARAVDPDATRTFTPAAATTTPSPATGDLTVAGSRLGTPRYMAPEAWRGERLTAASDVFSLGLVLWELFAGRHPLAAVEVDGLAAAAAKVPSLATADAAVAPAVVAVIDRAVAADAATRPVDAGALAEALAAAFAAPAVTIDDRPSRAAAALMIAVGGLALGGVAWVVRPRASTPVAGPVGGVVADAAPSAGEAARAAPVALTALGACASEPTFIDAATVAFTLMRGDDVDIHALVPGQPPSLVARTDGWDWHPAAGRHLGEVLFATDGDDQRMRIKALARATGALTEPMVGYSVAGAGDALFVLTDDDPGWIHRRDGTSDARLVEITGAADQLVAAPDGAHLAVVVADRATAPRVCLVDVAARTVRCPDTLRAQVGRPAFGRDGRSLYYPAATGLRALDVATGADRLVVPELRGNGGLAVAPDGRALVFSDCRSYGELVAVGPGGPEVLVAAGLVRSPAAAPGGGLAYVARQATGGTLIMLRAPGQPERTLVRDDGELGRPAFSDDGGQVAYARSGAGIWVQPLAGGAGRAWTSDAGARAPVWLATDGLAYTRTDGVRAAVWTVTRPGATPRRLVDGWRLEDRDGGRLLVMRAEAQLAWLDVATGRLTPIGLGALARQTLLAARVLPGAAVAVLTAETSAIHRLDLRAGTSTVLYRLPAGQTAGDPAVLTDGRVAFRAELWLGELYQLAGNW